MAEIPLIALHVTGQAAIGVLAGSVVDALFPSAGAPLTSTDTHFLRKIQVGAEVTLQLVANGFVTALLYRAIRRMGDSGMGDPTAALAYTFASLESQSQLKVKIKQLSDMVKKDIGTLDGTVEKGYAQLGGSQRGGKVQANHRQSLTGAGGLGSKQ